MNQIFVFDGWFIIVTLLLTACNSISNINQPDVDLTSLDYGQILIGGCQPKNTDNLQAVFFLQLIEADRAQDWTVKVSGQTCHVFEGQPELPALTIQMSGSDLIKLSQGDLTITEAYNQQDIKVRGAPYIAAKLPDIFAPWAQEVTMVSAATPIPISSPSPELMAAIPEGTPEPELTPTPALDPGYVALSEWSQFNADYLKGLGMAFAEAAESVNRQKIGLQNDQTAAEVPEIDDLAQLIHDYQTAWIKRQNIERELVGPTRHAPLNVVIHDVIEQKYEEAAYEIEIITWDAYPNFPVPANIYRPINATQKRLPAIISPLGCQTNVSTHNELNSVQRRAANLALRGFLVFTMGTGLCYDGLVGEQLNNSFAFEQYGRMSGSGFSNNSIDLLMVLRIVDYLATRPDVDERRIGATGYSYGGGLAYYLANNDPRIAALGLTATSIGAAAEVDDRVFMARRHGTMYHEAPDIFITNYAAPRLFPDEDEILPTIPPIPSTWSSLSNLLLLAPRPFYLVQGRADPGTSITTSQKLLNQLAELNVIIDPVALPPQLVVVEGSHNYNAERRRLITDWLVDVLKAEPVLPPPQDNFEHETPILERAILERKPPNFGQVTVHDIHAERALATINKQRRRHPFNQYSLAETQTLLRDLLMLPDDEDLLPGRPIELDEQNFMVSGYAISSQFWLLPLTHYLKAAVQTLNLENQRVDEVVLYLLPQDALMPTLDLLTSDIAAGRAVVVIYLPGFGPLRSTQNRTGQLALTMPTKIERTLLGVGVESVQATLDLVETLYPNAAVIGHSDGVDAGNVLAFSAALDERISEAHLYNSIDTFIDFLMAPTNPIPAPTMAIPGLAAYVDIPDLQELAGERQIVIESESDLSEYILDLRPCRPNC